MERTESRERLNNRADKELRLTIKKRMLRLAAGRLREKWRCRSLDFVQTDAYVDEGLQENKVD